MDANRAVAGRAGSTGRGYRPPTVVLYGSVAVRTLSLMVGSVADAMAMLQAMP